MTPFSAVTKDRAPLEVSVRTAEVSGECVPQSSVRVHAIVHRVNVVSRAYASFKAIPSSAVKEGSVLPVRLAKTKAVRLACVKVNQPAKALVIACLEWLVRRGHVDLRMNPSSAVAEIFVR